MEQNYKERAARAERIADRLAYYYALMASCVHAHNEATGDKLAAHTLNGPGRAALDQWAAHVDDYDTLDAAAAPCEHCGHPSSCTDYDPDPEA